MISHELDSWLPRNIMLCAPACTRAIIAATKGGCDDDKARFAMIGVALIAFGAGGVAAAAQGQGAERTAPEAPAPALPVKHANEAGTDQSDVIIDGQRGSAVSDIAPLARIDSAQIAAIGATSMAELLQMIGPMTRTADGSEPIFLLNGQRTSGYEEISSLPPEAIASFEILPEQAALKFGFPPTRRLVNAITKAHFRTIELKLNGGMATEGGGATAGANAALTRLANGRRLTVAGEYRHADPLLQSRRPIAADRSNLFDAIGNVTGIAGAEIDPVLSAAAGHPVFVAAVPADPGMRGEIGAYVAGAESPRLFDLGPYRTLVARKDAFKINAVLATPITSTISGSFTLSAERSRDRSLQGPAAAAILVPAGNPYSPFGRDILLNRYLTEGDPLAQRRVTTTLNAGAVLRGAISGWSWDLSGTLDEYDVSSRSERGVDGRAIGQAVAAGADPFAPLPSALLAARQYQQSTSRSRKAEAKAVARGTALHLPAGDLSMTATVEAERASAHTTSRGLIVADTRLARTRLEAGLAVDVPIASHDDNVLPFLGALSVNLSGNVRHVEGYGQLTDSTYGLTWGPLKTVQLLGTVRHTGTAPDMGQRSATIVQSTNVPFFDFATGQSVRVTTISGGNPNLAAQHGRVETFSISWRPLAYRARNNDLNISVSYVNMLTHNLSAQVSALTPATEAAFPDQFVRDASGRLTTIFFRPVNFYRKRQANLQLQINYNGPLGKVPPKPADPKTPPRQRPFVYAGIVPTVRLRDLIELKPGLAPLDLLNGGTFDGAGGRSKLSVNGWGGGGYNGSGFNFNWQWFGPSRIDGGVPQSDLHFSPIFKFGGGAYTALRGWFPQQDWARKATVTIEVVNLLDRRQHVRDAYGATPNRYQPGYLDPLGRAVKLTLRKLF